MDAKAYNEEFKDVTWETCTLWSWLNDTFYSTVFSTAEQGLIATTRVKNEDNPKYGTEGGNDTEDKLFLLSIGEVLNYFDLDPAVKDPARGAKVTAYAKVQGGGVSSSSGYAGNGFWWLRSAGYQNTDTAYVYDNGSVERFGYTVSLNDNVVRPALWLNPES